MTGSTPTSRAAPGQGSAPGERRRSPRCPLAGVLVGVETPPAGGGASWAGSGIDINGDGLSLSLTDDIESGLEVLLTFELDRDRSFYRVPAVVVRQQREHGVAAVLFRPWPLAERLDLVQHLLEHA